jgi:peptidyl-tRNA hydrolase ICT1
MAVIRTSTNMILKQVFLDNLLIPPVPSFSVSRTLGNLRWANLKVPNREISFSRIKCAGSDDKKVSSRLSQVQQLLQEAEERASAAGNEPPPKITLGIFNHSLCLEITQRINHFFLKNLF